MAQLIDLAMPEYREAFDRLEAVAWMPDEEPPDGSPDTSYDAEALYSFATAISNLERECANAAQRLRELEQTLREERRQRIALNSAPDDTRRANELVLFQLRQVQDELEYFYMQRRNPNRANRDAPNKGGEGQRRRFVSAKPSSAPAKTNQRRWPKLIPSLMVQRFRKLREKRQLREMIREVDASGLFDSEWYLVMYNDVRYSRLHPIEHYLTHGWKEGRNPGPNFDTNQYLEAHPDLARRSMNPLIHYLRYGGTEGRGPI